MSITSQQPFTSLSYAGIGSRETPANVLKLMARLASRLSELGFTLRTGGAIGADQAFESGSTRTAVYLPWVGYNNYQLESTKTRRVVCVCGTRAHELASKFHPAWDRLSQGARKLHARNCNIVHGADLESPVAFVLCWHLGSGGTMQAVRLANASGIPVINLAVNGWKDKLVDTLQQLYAKWIPKSPETVTGDLLTAREDFICHQVNCRGRMNRGLAKTIREAHPEVYESYRQACKSTPAEQLLGCCQIVGKFVNIFGQLSYGTKTQQTDYDALERAFKKLHAKLPAGKSIAFPYNFGCGLAGGDWNTVSTLISSCFQGRKVVIYRLATNEVYHKPCSQDWVD